MRSLKINTVYSHWKRNPDSIYNNYLYCTMGISKPVDANSNSIGKKFNVVNAFRTDNNKPIVLFFSENGIFHLNNDINKELVVYTALYSDSKPYVREISEFLSEVPEGRESENLSQQKYRFEEYK